MLLPVVLTLLAILAVLTLVSLRVKAKPFPAFPAQTPALATVPLPDDLPAPVARYLRAVGDGDALPRIDSAVLTGPARLRFGGITFNSRARFVEAGGHGYRHYIQLSLFGRPVLTANEVILDGTSRMELPFGVEQGPEIDQAANLSLWAEQVAWMPSISITDPRLRWEPVDATTARLFVPWNTGEDEFLVRFDPETGLLDSMEAMRYKTVGGEKVRWTVCVKAWQEFHGMQIPKRATLTWADENGPWATFDITEVVYNVDVDEYIRARGV